MAPPPPQNAGLPAHDAVEKELRELIQYFYEIMVQVKAYDMTHVLTSSHPTPTRAVLQDSFHRLHQSLQRIHQTSIEPNALPLIPTEIIDYVDSGRNPDIYNREFVELARRSNQVLKGKQEAFGGFTDLFAREMAKVLPECRGDIERVLDSTGRRKEALEV